jgi:hypothetical protein
MEETPAIKRKRAASGVRIEKELKEIYAVNDEPVDLATIDRGRGARRWPYVLVVGLVLFAMAGTVWAGIAYFMGGRGGDGSRVSIAIEGPTAPRSGEAGTWTITYSNEESMPLAKAELTLRVPNSLAVIETEPIIIGENSLTWTIGTIEPGGRGQVKVKGRITDAVDAPVSVQAVLAYRPSNFNADFEKTAEWNSRVADAAIEAKIEAPTEAVPGDELPFTVIVSRRADLSDEALIPDLRVRFDPAKTIVVKKAEPSFSDADGRSWSTPAPDDEELKFSVTGSFAADAAGDLPIAAEIGTVNAAGNFVLLAAVTATVKVLPGDLVLTLINNGSTNDAAADLGSALHVSLDYENKSDKPLGDVELSLTFAGVPVSGGTGPVDWESFDDVRGGKRSGNTVTWTKKEIPELATLKPGDKGSVDVSVKAVGAAFTTADRGYTIDLSGRGQIGTVEGQKSGKAVSTPVIRVALNSDTLISAAAAGAGGALPPKNGSATEYRVVWAITNSLHEISNIKVTAALPPSVGFASSGSVAAGYLRYDETSRTVTWTLNRLPTSFPSVSVDFTVAITPGSADVGKSLSILSQTSLAATDTATNALLSRTAAALDTNVQSEIDDAGIVQP